MKEDKRKVEEVLNAQHQHWESMLSTKPDMFGTEPSDPAQKAAELFKKEGKKRSLNSEEGRVVIQSSLLKMVFK